MIFGGAFRRCLTAARFSLFVLAGMHAAPALAAGNGAAHGQLDGMIFVGTLGPLESRDIKDVLYFRDGRFWSQSCMRLGFAPAPYWTRTVGNEIEFRGFLESAEKGRFSFLGRVAKNGVKVDIDWHHERWYWSVDRKMRFEGMMPNPPAANR